ncbi:hypothetical protein VEE48_14410 [Escherichia coli]|nr:hypothetical protein VEE48_14410 [Escherichia coli]
MSCEELEIVWNNIKAEARTLADCEPMLASFYHATLLKHENLGSALSYMLANKLSSPIMPAIAIREVVEEAYAADPEMIASAACDIQAVRTRDPAVDKYSTPLLYLKGFHALQAYRIGHWLWTSGASRTGNLSAKPGFCDVPGRYSPGSKNWSRYHA